MGNKSRSFESYLEVIPENLRNNVILLGNFQGNRSKISYTFSCGCIRNGQLKFLILRKNFEKCPDCLPKNSEVYSCTYCSKKFTSIRGFEKCNKKCAAKYVGLVLGKDYVVCQICNFHAKSIRSHVFKEHNINDKDYRNQYGSLICSNSVNNYSSSSKKNGNWIVKAKEEGRDLTEYWEKVSAGVKKSIMSDPLERKRRSELMTKLNNKQQSDPEFQKKVSETAKRTSSRKDILEKRSQRLKKWRDENPDVFYKKCTKKIFASFQSKPEKKLTTFLKSLGDFKFKRNGFLRSNEFTSKSKRRQIDIYDKENKIYVEYDGVHHFDVCFSEEILKSNQQKDSEINQYMINRNWTLIRVSYDQFVYSTKTLDKVKRDASYFKPECLEEIKRILAENKPGIYKIGEKYKQ